MQGIAQIIFAELGPEALRCLIFGRQTVLRSDELGQLRVPIVLDQLHAQTDIRDHEVEVVFGERSCIDLLTEQRFSFMHLHFRHLQIGDFEIFRLEGFNDLAYVEVSVWLDQHKSLLQILPADFLRFELTLREVVRVGCNPELPRVNRERGADVQVGFRDLWVLGPLEEHAPILGVIQVDRLVNEVVLE